MRKKQFLLVLAASFIGGIIGGLISEKIFTNHQAFAENGAASRIIEAKEFRVIDDAGNTIGSFGREDAMGAVLSIQKEKDKSGSGASVRLFYFGLEAEYTSPGYWKHEKVKTIIWPWGMSYTEFSKLDIDKNEKSFLGFTPPSNIRIGASESNSPGPAIILRDRNRNLRAVLGATDLREAKSDAQIQRPPSSLVLFNEQGKVVWQAP